MKSKAFIRRLAFPVLLIVAACGKEDDPVKQQLDPPSNLSAVVFSATQINLVWVDKVTGETGFKIERAPGGSTAFVEVGSVGSGVITFQNTGLEPNSLYAYRVKAFNANSSSIYSNIVSIATPDLPPSAPTNLTATVFTQTQINLNWSDNSTNEQGFKIEQAVGASETFTEVATAPSGTTVYQHTGLVSGTEYRYRVLAFNAGGSSTYSNTTAATTQILIAAPANLIAIVASGTQVDLEWTDNSNNEDGFKIERAPGSTTTFTEIGTVGAGVVTYSNTGLTLNTSYSYRVRAYNATDNSPYSDIATATTTTILEAPTNLVATIVSATQIDLSWADKSSNESGFRIERAPGSTTTFTEIGTVEAGVTVYSNTGLTANTSYSYRVRAYNATENSLYSNTAQGTTNEIIPAAPTNLAATVISTSQINLGWLDNSNNEDGFKIERSPAGTTRFAELTTVGPGVTTYQNTGLPANTGYVYRVRSYNSAGNSTYSNNAGAKTLPAPPAISAPATSTGSFNVTLTYTWPGIVSSADYYEFEESTTSSESGFTVVHTSPLDTHTSPYVISMSKTTGTYYYRARVNSSFVWSGYSSVIQVTVQAPSTLTVYATEDNTLGVSTTDSNLAVKVMNSGLLFCGCDFAIGAYASDFVCGSAAMKFGTLQSQISGKNILSAKLIVYVASLPADIGTTFAVNAFATAWNSSSITYDNQPNIYTSAQVNFTPPSTSVVPVQLNITQIVKNWASGTFANNGLLMRDLVSSYPAQSYLRMTGFESVDDYSNTTKRPKIVVEFQ